MPTYAYKCVNCHHRMDAFQKISDEPLSECPSCSSASLKRIPTSGLFQLHGSGWFGSFPAPAPVKENSGSSCCPCGKDACSKN